MKLWPEDTWLLEVTAKFVNFALSYSFTFQPLFQTSMNVTITMEDVITHAIIFMAPSPAPVNVDMNWMKIRGHVLVSFSIKPTLVATSLSYNMNIFQAMRCYC